MSGINLAATKTISFGIASALGGIGGTIYVAEVGIASPDDFSSLVAIYLIVGLVVGGVGTLEGAVIGGLVYALIPDWASSAFVPEWFQLIFNPRYFTDCSNPLYAWWYRNSNEQSKRAENIDNNSESGIMFSLTKVG